MTISLPVELESSIAAIVQSGKFRSMDDAMAEAVRLLVSKVGVEPAAVQANETAPANPLLGLWHDYADEMDEIVTEAYRQRQTDTWRDIDVG